MQQVLTEATLRVRKSRETLLKTNNINNNNNNKMLIIINTFHVREDMNRKQKDVDSCACMR